MTSTPCRFVWTDSLRRAVPAFLAVVGVLMVALHGSPAAAHNPPADPRQVVALDSGWKFNKGDVSGAEQVAFNDSSWPTLNLPHTWNALDGQDGGNNYYRGIGWYRKPYTPPAAWAGRQLFLKFGGANLVTSLYIDGALVGVHKGGFAAFVWDVTSWLTPGVSHLLAVKVDNRVDPDVIPLGREFVMNGGIYRSVTLIATDPVHVRLTDLASPGVYLKQSDVTAASADLQVTVKLRNDSSTSRAVTVLVDIVDAGGGLVQTLTSTPTIPAQAALDVVETTTIANPHLWHGRQDPYLYRVYVQVKAGGTLRDLVQQPLGFRFFRVDPTQGFFLNGQPLDLHGVNFHQDRLNKGWATTAQEQSQDVELITEVGATVVRLAHYQHHAKTYDLLDKAGIIVWSELPYVYASTNSTAFSNNAKQQLQEMIRQNYNHPAILFWGLFNGLNASDGVASTLVPQLHALAKQEDPDRLTMAGTVSRVPQNAPLNFYTDLIGVNDYWGWYRGDHDDFGDWMDSFHAQFPGRALGVSEFGAGASIGQHQENPAAVESDSPWHPEEFQALFHEAHWVQMQARPFLWAKLVWAMFDYAADARDEGDTPGRNDKGLVTYDRQVRKDAFYFFKAHWSAEPTLYITSRRFTRRPDNRVEVKVYSNLDAVELKVNGVLLGTQTSPDRIFKWTGVALATGANTIEALGTQGGQTYTDAVVWSAPAPGATIHGLALRFLEGIGLYEVGVIALIFLLLASPIPIAYKLAVSKNLPPARWVVLALIFNWPIVFALLAFPRR